MLPFGDEAQILLFVARRRTAVVGTRRAIFTMQKFGFLKKWDENGSFLCFANSRRAITAERRASTQAGMDTQAERRRKDEQVRATINQKLVETGEKVSTGRNAPPNTVSGSGC